MDTSNLYSIYKKNPYVFIDTRKQDKNKKGIFFAIKGDNFNGNKFALDAITNGCSYAIIDDPTYNTHSKTILVDNALKSLQDLAKIHRDNISIPIIGITGTNGKTTSKELIHNVLSSQYTCYATEGNFNNHIGVPLSILEISAEYDLAIIEMGANHQNEISLLCSISQPNYGVITNMGTAHLEGFGSLEAIIKSKNELYDFIRNNKGHLFVNNEDKKLLDLSKKISRTTYGKTGDIYASIAKKETYIQISYNKNCIYSQLIGDYQFYNIMLAICIGEHFDITIKNIKKSIKKYKPENNRSQIIKTKKNTLIMDAYNANPSSMIAMLTSFSNQEYENKMCILGDMLELGQYSEIEHKKIVLLCDELMLDVIYIGNEFRKINKDSFINRDSFISYIKEKPLKNKTILLKGSRGIYLEKLIDIL